MYVLRPLAARQLHVVPQHLLLRSCLFQLEERATQRVKKAELQALRGTLLELEQARAQQQAQDNEVELPGSRPWRQERARDDGLEHGGGD